MIGIIQENSSQCSLLELATAATHGSHAGCWQRPPAERHSPDTVNFAISACQPLLIADARQLELVTGRGIGIGMHS